MQDGGSLLTLTQTVRPDCQPADKAMHVTITVSGFMSQDSTGESWLPMLPDNDRSSVLYQLTWKALTKDQVMQVYNKIVMKQGTKTVLLSLLNGALTVADIVTQLPDLYTGISEPFRQAKASAKLTGRLLACCLAAGYPFKNQTVSLVGFSLGCQVIKSCLKMLDKLGAKDILHEVIFLGGATNCLDRPKNSHMWQRILAN